MSDNSLHLESHKIIAPPEPGSIRLLGNTNTIFLFIDSKYALSKNGETRIDSRKMIPRIFNMENPFNVKGKNHTTKPVNISTIKIRIRMTLSTQENISQLHPTMMVSISLNSHQVWWKLELSFSLSLLLYFSLDGMR